jgi:8-oxo-dGTP pyrophosphatase MutT (NUDIX family)
MKRVLAVWLLSSAAAAAVGRRGYRSSSGLLTALSLSGGSGGEGGSQTSSDPPSFIKLSEELAYPGRYRQIKHIKYQYPHGREVDFDILTQHGQGSVVVVAWDTKSKTATLIREFHPGVGRMQFGTIAGMLEKDKHANNPQECARMELEEEAHLRSDRWIRLLDEGRAMSFEKYSDNHFHAYLVLDPEVVPNPKALDLEEYIIIERNVPYSKIMQLIRGCEINVMSSYALLLAFAKLDELGIQYRD